MAKGKKVDSGKKVYTIHTKSSSHNNSTSGSIIINAQGYHKAIPAVVFSSDKAERLLEIVQDFYSDSVAQEENAEVE